MGENFLTSLFISNFFFELPFLSSQLPQTCFRCRRMCCRQLPQQLLQRSSAGAANPVAYWLLTRSTVHPAPLRRAGPRRKGQDGHKPRPQSGCEARRGKGGRSCQVQGELRRRHPAGVCPCVRACERHEARVRGILLLTACLSAAVCPDDGSRQQIGRTLSEPPRARQHQPARRRLNCARPLPRLPVPRCLHHKNLRPELYT